MNATEKARAWLHGELDLDPRDLVRQMIHEWPTQAVEAGGCAPPVLVDAVALAAVAGDAEVRRSGSVKENLPARKKYPKPDENGNDTGPCCAHAYADGWNECLAATKTLKARQAVEGMVLVPREPTEAMLDAGKIADDYPYGGTRNAGRIFSAMVAAAHDNHAGPTPTSPRRPAEPLLAAAPADAGEG